MGTRVKLAVTNEMCIDIIRNYGKPDNKEGLQLVPYFAKKYSTTEPAIQGLIGRLRKDFDIPKVKMSSQKWSAMVAQIKAAVPERVLKSKGK